MTASPGWFFGGQFEDRRFEGKRFEDNGPQGNLR